MTEDPNLNLGKEEVHMICNALNVVCQIKDVQNFEKHMEYPQDKYEDLLKKMGEFYAFCKRADLLAASQKEES